MSVVVNARNMNSARITGVQRYSREIVSRLGTRIDLIAPAKSWSGIKNHAWEQTVLPSLVGKRLLWSPANTGPLSVKRQVVTIHDMATLDHPEWFDDSFARWYRIMLLQLARRSQHILTVSHFSKFRISALTGVAPSKISVTPLAADSRFRPLPFDVRAAVREKYRLPGAYALTVGSLEPRKNLSFLFEVWERWAARPSGLPLVVVGGTGRAFKDRGFKSLPPGVVLIDHLDDENLPALYAAASFFVYPSVYEGFGLPPLEAMACGTPVLCSNAASLLEVVGSAALTFSPTDPAELLNLLELVGQDQGTLQELREKGLKQASGFSWQTTAEATWDVLSREAEQ